MKAPKARRPRRFWETVSDTQLLHSELTTDDPEALDDLVFEVPAGEQETYVEFKYDLRKSGRTDEFSCVHGHHKHLAGFVMRKGGKRFLVGWMCGKTIYGEDFDEYTADFDAAINRQHTLRRRRDIEEKTVPFMAWLEQVMQSNIFKSYQNVRGQLRHHLPWVWENVPRAALLTYLPRGLVIPQNFFDEKVDPHVEFAKIVSEMSAFGANLIQQDNLEEKSVANIKRQLGTIVARVDKVFAELKEVEDFFQPSVLTFVCKLANDFDNPKKRKYTAGLMELTCKRDRDKTTVQVPKSYRLPNRNGLEALKESLRVL